MSGMQGVPAARPVDESAWTGDDQRPWDVDRWLRAGLAGAVVLGWVLTDVAMAVLTAAAVVAAASTVRARRGGVRWWTALEIASYGLLLALTPVLSARIGDLPGAVLAAQVAVGALVGTGLVGVVSARRRANARRRAPSRTATRRS